MELIKKGVLPIIATAALTWIGKDVFYVGTGIDWLWFLLVYGIPFGIPYMLTLIPVRGSVAGGALIFLLDITIGTMIGCVIAAVSFVRAVLYLIRSIALRKGICSDS